ncbi:hypothetical protein H9P43_003567 [Blastocladiella emersonii ATCC 22665]|nr:hypothetical protein H9P43_003567 [Blastocladiella emersonii ATCC 22665]
MDRMSGRFGSSSRTQGDWRRPKADQAEGDGAGWGSFTRRSPRDDHVEDTDKSSAKSKVCRFYQEKGWCRYGDKCFNSHNVEVNVQARKPAQKKAPCTHFLRGSCRYGDDCRFSHDIKPAAPKPQQHHRRIDDHGDLAKAVRDAIESPTAADDHGQLYVMPKVSPSTYLARYPGIKVYGTSELQPDRAAIFLAEILRQIDENPTDFLDALNNASAALTTVREIASYSKYTAEIGIDKESFQTVLLPLLFLLSHPALETSTLTDKVALIRDAAAESTQNLIDQFVRCTRAALSTRSLVEPLALDEVRSQDYDEVRSTFKPLSFAQAFVPFLKYLGLLAAACNPDTDELETLRAAFKEIEGLVDEWEPLVGMVGDDAFGAIESPRAVELVRAVLAKAKRPLAGAMSLADQLKAQLEFKKRAAAATAASPTSLSGRAPSMVIPATRPVSGARRNDHADYRRISIVPTMAEIMSDDPPTLPGNLQFDSEAHWLPPGPTRLLDTHFRLLRHDMLATIKGGVRLFLDHLNSDQPAPRAGRFERNTESMSADLMVYTNVWPRDYSVDNRAGVTFNVRFDRPQSVKYADFMSSCLQWGNLVCVFYPESPTGPYTAEFATVAFRDKLDNNKVGLAFLNTAGTAPPGYRVFLAHESRVHGYRATPPVYLAEFRGFLFEAYRPVLKALQDAAPWSLPFADVICPLEPPQLRGEGTRVPRYARADEFAFDLSFLAINPGSASINFAPASPGSLNRTMALLAEHSELDTSQATALLQALSTDMCCIQGPPGTGKSRVGVSIARAIIGAAQADGGRYRSDMKILVMCHTNHALDQFLLGLVNAGFMDLVRIGSRCSEELEKYRLDPRDGGRGRDLKEVYELLEPASRLVASSLNDARSDVLGTSQAAMPVVLPRLWDSIRSRQFRNGDSYAVWFRGRDLGPNGVQHIVPLTRRAAHLRQAPRLDLGTNSAQQLLALADDAARLAAQRDRADLNGGDFGDLDDDYDGVSAASAPDPAPAVTTASTAASAVPWRATRSLAELLACDNAWSMTKRERALVVDHLIFDNEYMGSRNSELSPRRYLLDLDDEFEYYSNFGGNCADLLARLKRLREAREIDAARHYTVVGMTTTGAAARPHLLRGLSPAVIICEEAGEILEAHTLAAMHPQLQHLILIGDHKQLRPKINNYDLSVQSHLGRAYRLDISMFERLIVPERDDLVPALGHAQLQHQRRMKPIISQFIRRGGIYPELMDGANTLNRPAIRGMTKDVFFMAHAQPQLVASDGLSSGSHSNQLEAQMAVALVDYLLRQGYAKDQIVVVTPYIGQLALINQVMKQWRIEALIGERDYQELIGRRADGDGDDDDEPTPSAKRTAPRVRVACVDAYQGEEADIIILSMVRSSLRDGSDRGIGFLKVANRVNVMLSRAKLGMYMIGNAALLDAKSDLWSTLFDVMREQNLIGPAFEIGCPNHPDTRHLIDDPAGFRQHAPEGGCSLPCGATFACGHGCRRLCHGDDRDHAAVVCRVRVDPVALPRCGHAYSPLCHETADLESIKCTTTVEHTRGCGHSISLPCHKTADLASTKCAATVEHTRSCGHSVSLMCHEVAAGAVGECRVPVERVRGCGHAVTVPCSKNADDEGSCRVDVDPVAHPRCGHTITPKCFQVRDLAAVSCGAVVEKQRSCGHSVKVACHQDADKTSCTWTCSATLACSHACSAGSSKSSESDCDCHRRHALSAGSSADSSASLLCPPCSATSVPRCDHSRPSTKCGEPSAPCAVASCAWTACSHGVSACEMPCSAPCTRLPCDSRCERLLRCGHRCPSICGEICPDSAFCRECASAETRAQHVGRDGGDVQYGALDVDARPVVALKCRHVVPVDVLDAHVGLDKYYARGDDDAIWSRILPLGADAGKDQPPQTCPLCATPVPLAHIRRYGRIFKAAPVELYDAQQLDELKAVLGSSDKPLSALMSRGMSLVDVKDKLEEIDGTIASLGQNPSRQLHLACARLSMARSARGDPVDDWSTLKYERVHALAHYRRGVMCSAYVKSVGRTDLVAAECYFDDACSSLIFANKVFSVMQLQKLAFKSTAAWLDLNVAYISMHARLLDDDELKSPAQLSRDELVAMLEEIQSHVARLAKDSVPDGFVDFAPRLTGQLEKIERELSAADADSTPDPIPLAV